MLLVYSNGDKVQISPSAAEPKNSMVNHFVDESGGGVRLRATAVVRDKKKKNENGVMGNVGNFPTVVFGFSAHFLRIYTRDNGDATPIWPTNLPRVPTAS